MLIMVLRVRDFRMLILVVIRPPVRVSHGLPLPRTEPGKECIKGCLAAWSRYGKPGDGVLGAVVSAAQTWLTRQPFSMSAAITAYISRWLSLARRSSLGDSTESQISREGSRPFSARTISALCSRWVSLD